MLGCCTVCALGWLALPACACVPYRVCTGGLELEGPAGARAGCWDVPASTSLYCAVLPEVMWLPCTRGMACCVCTAVCTLLSLRSAISRLSC